LNYLGWFNGTRLHHPFVYVFGTSAAGFFIAMPLALVAVDEQEAERG
jgi:hypothetical protein